MLDCIKRHMPPSQRVKVYADIEGETLGGCTVPPNVLPTQQIPDICYVDYEKKEMVIIELTVPFETNISDANHRKQDRYAGLVHDITTTGWDCALYCVEIGSRGLITPQNKQCLHDIMKACHVKFRYPDLRDRIVFGSYGIFYSRSEPVWQHINYLHI